MKPPVSTREAAPPGLPAAPPARSAPPVAAGLAETASAPMPARGANGAGAPERLAVLALTLLGFGLRLFRLDAQSMWLDEAGRVEIARLGLGGVVQGVSVIELCPPLYHALAALWIGATGDGDFAIRLLSACTGLLAVPLSWALARRLLAPGSRDWEPGRPSSPSRQVVPAPPSPLPGGEGADPASAVDGPFDAGGSGRRANGAGAGLALAGVGAAAAAALSPFYVFYAQEAAQYSLLLVLALLQVYLLLRLIDGAGAPRLLWLALVAATTAGLYTQYYFGFLLAGEGVFLAGAWLLGRHRHLLPRWLGAMALSGALFLPWLPYLQRQALLAASNAGWGAPSVSAAAETIWAMTWAGFDSRLDLRLTLLSCLPALLLGLWTLRCRLDRLWLMASLLLVPFALAVGSAAYFHSFRERGFLIVAFIPYTLLGAALGWGGAALTRSGLRSSPSSRGIGRGGSAVRSASLLLAAASLGVMALALVNSYRYVEKENWRQAVAWVRGSERDGDGIFFIHYGMQVPFDRYYRGALDRNGLPADFDWADGYYKRNVFNALDVPTSLAPRAARYQRLWLVLSHDGGRGSDVAIAFLDRAWRRADTREWTGVRVLLYERPSARSSLPARDS